jgi:hypothetical protein
MSNCLILIAINVCLNIHKVKRRSARATAKTRPRESFHPVNGSRNRCFGGGQTTVIVKPGEEHFPVAPQDPTAVVDFIVAKTQ